MLMTARRPIIYAGGGVILGRASAQLTELTQNLGFPITNTLMGIGCYPATDKQHLGWLGRSEEHTSELQSRPQLVCRPLLEKKALSSALRWVGVEVVDVVVTTAACAGIGVAARQTQTRHVAP